MSSADRSVFASLAELSAPRVETRRHFTFGEGMIAEGASRAAAPTVVAQVQLGPLEATTLTGGNVSSVTQWLDAHGYTMRREVVAQLDPYLEQGWAFVATRLTSSERLDGQLVPVKMVFASDRLVYPMRMSAAAKSAQQVVVYTLGQHRMQRIDADAAQQNVTVEYAGSIAGRTHDETLTELASHGALLTKISVGISDPSAISSDFEFAGVPNDDPYQQVVYRNKDVVIVAVVLVVVLRSPRSAAK